MERERVLIFDTSLRDGEQAPGCSMNTEEKLALAHKLQQLGVDIIEAGFPIASVGDADAVRRVATEVEGPIIAGLARCVEKDIRVAWEALRCSSRPRIHTFLATSDIHLAFKLKIGHEEALQQAARMVAYAHSLCADVEFSPEDATRSDVNFLCEVLQAAVEAGATTLNIPDTVGYTTPVEFGELIRTIRSNLRNAEHVTISVHCHNDLGLAVANSLAGIEAGARQVECTVNGIGERAGNAALEEIAMVLHVRKDRYTVETGIRHEEIHSSSRLLSKILGFDTQPNKAIVGRNAFAHEAGIHQHGVLNNPLCYEIMTPETVGLPPDRIVLGKHSGRHALAYKFKEMGFQLSGEEIDRVYHEFTRLADKKKHVYEQDLLSMLFAQRSTVSQSQAAAEMRA
ncbi:MAG: 2-isopropylmalate synthase [Acidobacteriota bacterium]|nr:2-isopropylmalate synthase [Acidobacteriota bacterium]